MQVLGLPGVPLRYAQDIAPGAKISIIRSNEGERRVEDAIWWLLLDRDSLKPNYKYASFNSRADKLNNTRAISYQPYRYSRCIIPASAFVEGLGDKKTYHKIELVDQAIVFGGLYKEWLDAGSGELVYSASIITLPPLMEWQHIHPKSFPLLLPLNNSALIEQWLDPKIDDVALFDSCLQPQVSHPQRITPIEKPSNWKETGKSFIIANGSENIN